MLSPSSISHPVILLLLSTAASFASAAPPLVVPADGKPFAAELTAVGGDWQLTFQADKEKHELPAAELVSWGTCAEVAGPPVLVLADGGLLVVNAPRADKDVLTADSVLVGKIRLPLELLSGVVFHFAGGRQERDLLLDRVARAAGQSDQLVLSNGDQLSGLVERLENDAVHFRADVGPLTVHTDRVAALVFSPALHRKVDEQGLRTWVGLSDGSRLMAEKLVVDGGAAQITTLGGQTWKAAPKDIFWLQPLGGRAVYLSQLRAAEYRHVPYLGLAWPYQTDRNVTGGWLRANGRLYPFGLGVHSAAHLVYELPGANESPLSPLGRGAGGEGKPSLSDPSNNPYKRFQAELAIDDSTAGGGSVRFLVIVDGRGKYASDTIRGGMPLVPVSVDIEGAKRLELVVDFADRADVLDHADWLNARLIR